MPDFSLGDHPCASMAAKPAPSSNDSMWFGAKSMYDSAGFKEVARRKPFRPIVRLKPV